MTEKICPIMSRAYLHKFDNSGFSEEETRLHYIGCLEDRCMAWNNEGQCSVGALRDECPHMDEDSFECEKCEKWVLGFCKLIDKEFP